MQWGRQQRERDAPIRRSEGSAGRVVQRQRRAGDEIAEQCGGEYHFRMRGGLRQREGAGEHQNSAAGASIGETAAPIPLFGVLGCRRTVVMIAGAGTPFAAAILRIGGGAAVRFVRLAAFRTAHERAPGHGDEYLRGDHKDQKDRTEHDGAMERRDFHGRSLRCCVVIGLPPQYGREPIGTKIQLSGNNPTPIGCHRHADMEGAGALLIAPPPWPGHPGEELLVIHFKSISNGAPRPPGGPVGTGSVTPVPLPRHHGESSVIAPGVVFPDRPI